MKVYHYAKCSTCRKALAWLAAHGHTVETLDIVTAPPSKAILARAAELAGISPKKMFNTSGESYRAGNFKERLATMTDDEALAALAADGKLIKRPLLIGPSVALIGFKEADWAARLT